MDTSVLSSGGKAGHDVDRLRPYSAEVKNEGSYTSTPTICIHGLDRENFTLFSYEVFSNDTIKGSM
jgi:hypothetical protein